MMPTTAMMGCSAQRTNARAGSVRGKWCHTSALLMASVCRVPFSPVTCAQLACQKQTRGVGRHRRLWKESSTDNIVATMVLSVRSK